MRQDGGLGKKVERPVKPQPEWRPVEGKPHLEINSKGQLRTVIAQNALADFPWVFIDPRCLS